MNFYAFNPKKTKWQVSAYTIPQGRYQNQPFRRFSGEADEGEGWMHQRLDWTMPNFIFQSEFEYQGISLGRSACHIRMIERFGATPNQFIFIPRTLDSLFELIKNRVPEFTISPTGVFSGIFTFEKVGTSLFVSPFREELPPRQELPPAYQGRM